MPTGLQVWDNSGNLRLDLSDRIFKFFGVANIGNTYTGTTAAGTIADSRFTQWSGAVPFAFIINGNIDPDGNAPEFSISGNVLTWTFPRSVSGSSYTRPDTTFTYGIY